MSSGFGNILKTSYLCFITIKQHGCMITLYLARHGQTVENLSRIFQGHLPGTLTEEGKNRRWN